ncbi:hypothetical protein M4V62_04080 [Streptomyces durmitorensis]|uniref:Uncharacterized protein n=1 Tax=Streptomyces durmitorensis TaxID=319947 RepID=A0ABY4PMH9_9ACTN|nr:hypothetical protein [Streptomyces durmitorensis]UQT54325.1 hypothetical protein M4V62_04080 [Streptomyces durmitorensis]
MTWRQLRVLIQHLPPESSTMTALRNKLSGEELTEQAEKGEPEKGRWSQLEQLTASVLDAVRRLEYVTICANTEKKRDQPEPPTPTPRPGAKPRKPKPKITEQAAERLFELINGGAA